MGAFFSKYEEKLKVAAKRGLRLMRTTQWITGNALWMFVTGFIVLGAPAFVSFDRECSHFEMQTALETARMNSAAADAQMMQGGMPGLM